MAVADKILGSQIKRLLSLPFAPTEADSTKLLTDEYKRILRAKTINERHLLAIVDHLMETSGRCPAPAAVREAAETVPAPDLVRSPPGCEMCEGTGYVHLKRMVRIAGMEPYEADYSGFCRCELGQFYKGGAAYWEARQATRAGGRK